LCIGKNRNAFPTPQTQRGFRRIVVDQHFPLLDQLLNASPAGAGNLAGQELVEPLTSIVGLRDKGFGECVQARGILVRFKNTSDRAPRGPIPPRVERTVADAQLSGGISFFRGCPGRARGNLSPIESAGSVSAPVDEEFDLPARDFSRGKQSPFIRE
jgi:hypothetical protein